MTIQSSNSSADNALESPVFQKEIDLVQNCITRMAQNSFFLKGWTVSLIGAAFVFSSGRLNTKVLFLIAALALAVTLIFWYLDAYYLRQERLYRKLYEWLLATRPHGNYERVYDLDTSRFSDSVEGICGVMWSKTLRAFYGSISVIAVLFILCLAVFKASKLL